MQPRRGSVWEFVGLGVMGQLRRRLEDRHGSCLSMRRRTWWRAIGRWHGRKSGKDVCSVRRPFSGLIDSQILPLNSK